MKKYWLLLASLAVVLTLSLTGCGGGGGGGGSSDTDRDGIPNSDDDFPRDATKFAAFTKVDLPGLQGSSFSSAVAINDAGLIVGSSNDAQGDLHGVFWSGSTAVAPTPLTFPAHLGGEFGVAYGINSNGDVVGESNNAGGGRDAIFWLGTAGTPSGAMAMELVVVPGATMQAAYDINNVRRIAGEAQSATGTQAVSWTITVAGSTATSSQPMILGVPAGGTSSSAYAIGEDNKIVGEYNYNGTPHGILWTLSADGSTVASMIDLPPLTGDVESVAYGINANGQIIGESTSAAGVTRGVTWTVVGTAATPTVLGTLAEGTSLAINDSGLLAGWVSPTVGGTATASVWDVRKLSLFNNVIADGTGFSQGFGINNTGSVVGMAGNTAFVGVPQ